MLVLTMIMMNFVCTVDALWVITTTVPLPAWCTAAWLMLWPVCVEASGRVMRSATTGMASRAAMASVGGTVAAAVTPRVAKLVAGVPRACSRVSQRCKRSVSGDDGNTARKRHASSDCGRAHSPQSVEGPAPPIDIYREPIGSRIRVHRTVAQGWDGTVDGETVEVAGFRPKDRQGPDRLVVLRRDCTERGIGKGKQLNVLADPRCTTTKRSRASSFTPVQKKVQKTPAKPNASSGGSACADTNPTPKTSVRDDASRPHPSKTPSTDTCLSKGSTHSSDDRCGVSDLIDEGKGVYSRTFNVRPNVGSAEGSIAIKITGDRSDVAERSRDFLYFMLSQVSPLLDQTLAVERQTDRYAAVRASLNWAWRQDAFKGAMTRMPSAQFLRPIRSRSGRSKSRTTEFMYSEATLKQWVRVIRVAKRNTEKSALTDVYTVASITRCESVADVKAKKHTQRTMHTNSVRGSVRTYAKQVQSVELDALVYGIDEFTSYAGYKRFRENKLDKPDDDSRRIKHRGVAGVAIDPGPQLKTVQTERDRRTNVIGMQPDSPINTNSSDGTIELGTPTIADSAQIGILHDYKSWVAVCLREAVSSGDCSLSLHKPCTPENPEHHDGWLGDFPDLHLSLWGDNFPAASRNAGNAGWTIIDRSGKLFRKGRSHPIPAMLWHGKEELMINIVEAIGCKQLASDEWLEISFPECNGGKGTYLRVKLPLKQLCADHKMWCEVTGNIGSGGTRRLHFLMPHTSIHLANDVYTFENCSLGSKVIWQLRTLHNTMQQLRVLLQKPENFTAAELSTWLQRDGSTVKITEKAKLVRHIQQLPPTKAWPDATWQVVMKELQLPLEKQILPRKKVVSVGKACQSATGVVGFPILTASNPVAFALMEQTSAELVHDVTTATEADNDTARADGRRYLSALVDLEHIVSSKLRTTTTGRERSERWEPSTQSLRARSGPELNEWLVHRCNTDNTSRLVGSGLTLD
eukprot:COSAG01_NODE_6988_length_3402_cov_2.323645_1_plen_973_part_10